MPRKRKEDDFDRNRRLEREARERAIALMWKQPAYVRLQQRKDKAVRDESLAYDMYRVTRRPVDQQAQTEASKRADRALKAMYRYERAFLKKHGVSW